MTSPSPATHMHKFLRLALLKLVTVFAGRFRGEHIVGLTQPMGLGLSSFIKYQSAAGITDADDYKYPNTLRRALLIRW